MSENEQTNLAAVLRLAESGWRLFPCSARDKRPLTPQGVHDATTDAAQLVEWAERHPGCLWATPDALVLDVDTHDGGADGYAAYRALADENGGDGGSVAVPTRVLGRKSRPAVGVDVIAELQREIRDTLSPPRTIYLSQAQHRRLRAGEDSMDLDGNAVPFAETDKAYREGRVRLQLVHGKPRHVSGIEYE